MKPAGTRVTWLVVNVAPRRGAWIETYNQVWFGVYTGGRTPQGCVD